MNMMSSANMMVAASDEDFNTRYAAYHGTLEAMRRVKPIPRLPAEINLVEIVMNEKIETTDQAVRYFHNLLLRVPLSLEHQTWLTAFLNRELGTKDIRTSITYLEEPLRMLVHLIMSTPEYQLS